MKTDPEPLVKHYGEEWRKLIEDSLKWLDETEPTWNLSLPINRDEFVGELIWNAKGNIH